MNMYRLGVNIKKTDQRGQAMTEYLVAMLVVMMMIGISFTGEVSVIDLFLNSVQAAFDNLSSFLSLPL